METFKNVVLTAANSLTTAYTAPGASGGTQRSILLGVQVTNITVAAVTVDCQIYDTSGAAGAYLCKDLSVPVAATINLLAGKTVLEAADLLKIKAGSASAIDVVVSTLEIT